MYRTRSGFTIVELLVVIAIIGIIGSLTFFNIGEGSAQARDAERQADLRNVETALELYRQKYGRYPEGCNGANNWSGQLGNDSACAAPPYQGTNEYIIGLAPEFLPTLPTDPRLNGSDSGYVYTVNGEGTVYKFKILNTVESETVTWDHPFRSCDITENRTNVNCADTPIPPEQGGSCFGAVCDYVRGSSPITPPQCNPNNTPFQTSYAVWGGYAEPTGNIFLSDETKIERNTEAIICR